MDKIADDVAASKMTDKNLGDMMNEIDRSIRLTVNWDSELNVEDKIILDDIVEDSLGKKRNNKSRETIMQEIFNTAEPKVQLSRLISALNVMATMIAALDNLNFDLARDLTMQALKRGLILQEDYDFVISKIPVGKYE